MYMSGKCFTYIIIFTLLTGSGLAQDEIQITNFDHAKLSFNPSFAGNSGRIDILVLARQQWLGYDAAPSTQLISIDTDLGKIGGIGLSVVNDKLGNERSVNIRLNYAYRYYFTRNSSLAIGIAGGMVNSAFSAIDFVYEEFDPNGIYNDVVLYMPDLSLGLSYVHDYFSLGLSYRKIYPSTNKEVQFEAPDYYHAYADFNYPLTSEINLIPRLHWHSTLDANILDAGIIGVYQQKLYAGLSYRLNDALIGLIGYEINKKLTLGYSFDFTLGELKSYNSGSHEIFIHLSLKKPEKEYFYYKSPRHF